MSLLRRVAVCVVVSSLFASPALADDDEASVHLQLVGGIARVADDAASDETSTAPLGGLEGRFSYATSDWYQFDATLTLAATGGAHFELGTFDPPGPAGEISGPFDVSMQLARIDAGVTARLGVQFIPTFRIALGAQGRRTSSPSGFAGTVRDARLGADLVALASVGFDYRINRHTIIGLAVGGTYAVPLGGDGYQSFEGTVFWSRYWYPRW